MLDEAVFQTKNIPPGDRFEYWRDHMSHTYTPVEIDSSHATDFSASQRILNLGTVRLWVTQHTPMTVRRTPQLIRESDPELYHLSLPLRGAMKVAGPDRSAAYAPYDLALQDTSYPQSMQATANHSQERVSGIGLFVPQELLPLSKNRVDQLVMRRIPGRAGFGALIAQFLTRLAADTSSYQPSDGLRLGTILVDLLSALLAHFSEADNRSPTETHRQALKTQIRIFIQQNLQDPQLTPQMIAAAHHISISYLHRLFQDEERTVASSVRQQRLERARRDLTDPAMETTSIRVIATRWGFIRPADFTRAFRSAYGIPPKEYRYQTH
ncbi:AraC-like ligand-binding domain-containing protein [Streptomyces sp. DSM 41534]